MSFSWKRRYTGPVKAVIFDLAGTLVDYGSCAPAGAFVELFRREGVPVTDAEAREPMGLQKKEHIRALGRMPSVAAGWEQARGAAIAEADIDRLYETFIPLQVEILPEFCTLIPGALPAVRELEGRGIRIAATTGYNREMMDTVLREAAAQGFTPEAAVCSDDVPQGRPAPWMLTRAMEALGVYPPEASVAVGDTLPDIEAGLNAGVWTVGLTLTGNMLGLSAAEAAALPPEEKRRRLLRAGAEMAAAGAHYTIESTGDLPTVIDDINRRLARGERP